MRRIAALLTLVLLATFGYVWIAIPSGRAITKSVPYIFISGNQGFTAASGVTAGNGSATNPYIIEGWSITGAYYPQGAIELYGTSAYVIIRNVDISNSGSCSGIDGIYLGHASNVQVANSTISKNNDGIRIDNSSTNITISKNILAGNCLALELQSTANLDIVDNTITNNGYGNSIYAHPAYNLNFANNHVASVATGAQFEGGNTRISRNTFINDGDQGLLVQGNNFTIIGNTASNDKDGLEIYATNSVVMNNTASSDTRGFIIIGSNNTIAGNYAQSNAWNGIVVQNGSHNNITSNYLSSNGVGIALQSAPNSTISGNDLYKDGTGLSTASSNSSLVYRNNFLSNTIQISTSNALSLSLSSTYPAGGNYWSNYHGVDQCNGPLQNNCTGPDGIGDTAFVISTGTSSIQDPYPLMKPYGNDRPPRWPLGSQVTTSNADFYGVTVSWTAATDDTAVASYHLYENNSLVATILAPALSYRATGLMPGDVYRLKVEANDTAGLSTSDGPSIVFTAPRELPAPQPPPSAEVIIRQGTYSTSFDPGTLTISQGQTVTWCNVGTLPVTVIFASASYTVDPTYWSNGSWDPCIHLTFYDSGTFGYYDVYSSATGQIVVNPVPPDFSLSVNPSQVHSFSSAPGRSTITITRLGYFNGDATFSLSISRSGLTCSLSSQKVMLKQSTIIGLLCTGPTGTYNVTIVGASETTTHYTSIIYSDGSSPGPGPQPQPSSGPQPRSTPPSASPTQTGSITVSVLRMIKSFFDRFAIWAGIGLAIAVLLTVAAIWRTRRR